MSSAGVSRGCDMAIPKYNELYMPLLHALQDGNAHAVSDIENILAAHLGLTAEEQQERLPSGALTFRNRIYWARLHLKNAGLLLSPGRGLLQISDAGKKLLAQPALVIDDAFLVSRTAVGPSAQKNTDEASASEDSPQDVLEKAYADIRQALSQELLDEIMQQHPAFFERLVVQLLTAMGYGGADDRALTTRYSRDEGIDGIISLDKLGFDQIYVQAKRWDPATSVGRPEIQKFVGALAGQGATRGLFITTARFSEDARDYARKQHTVRVVLVDGQRLAELMIDHNLGVTPIACYEIRRIDSDFFDDA